LGLQYVKELYPDQLMCLLADLAKGVVRYRLTHLKKGSVISKVLLLTCGFQIKMSTFFELKIEK